VRVVVTCDWFLKYAASQSAALARSGAEVLLLCRDHALEFGGDREERSDVLAIARDAGVVTVELPGRLSDVRRWRRLVAIHTMVKSFRAEVVHAHAGADPRALTLVPAVPTVLTVHDLSPHPGQPVARAFLKRWCLERADRAWSHRAAGIIVHSERLRGEVRLRDRQRCFVVPHGLDVRKDPLPLPAVPTVGFFGRFEPYKGLDVLARAMRRVWARRPEVLLNAAGSGTSELRLEDPRVSVRRGYLPEGEIERFFAMTSLAVVPYTEASQTGVGSRAVGFGIPVVTTRLGGLPDLALDGSYLADPGDEHSLTEAILTHLDDDMSVRARVLAELATPRSWDAAATRSVNAYRELTSASPTSPSAAARH
jgi:glycosyltransferase involved in cell wall biosynthesis